MRFYNNLFGAYNSILRMMRRGDTEFTSIIFVTLSQVFHFFLIIGIIREISGIVLFYKASSKYYYLFFAIPWFFLVYKYYSKERREKILKEFKTKSNNGKLIWGVIGVLTIMTPLIVFPFLFN